jgi:hypothetical protein
MPRPPLSRPSHEAAIRPCCEEFRQLQGVFEDASCFADDCPKFKFDRLKMRVDPFATYCFQGAEQPIAPISLTFGHGKLV